MYKIYKKKFNKNSKLARISNIRFSSHNSENM